MTRVRTTYLELRSPDQLTASTRVPDDVLLVRATLPSPELSRFLYTAVGGDWYWTDRLAWGWSRWMERLARPELETWVALVQGTPAGYFELEVQSGPCVEIAYFGILPSFAGRGLGGYLLANYLKRGFVRVREEETDVSLPPEPPGPWPGSGRPR
jgi:GNAT superfamily N-acetyltransferase